MKKLSLILAALIALALITTGCGPWFNPPIGPPQGPQPQGPIPQGPQPGGPQPGQPGPGQLQPGVPEPGQPQPGQPGPGQPPMPGQPGQPPQPPTPGQPPAPVQPTATKKSGGSNPTATVILAHIIQIDLQATDMTVDSAKYVHIQIKNNSTYSGDISFGVSCKGDFSVGGSSSSVSYSTQSVTFPFNANQERNTNSNIKLDKGTGYYKLTCTISELVDPNPSNNSITKTLTISP